MELNEYQRLAQRTCNMTDSPEAKVENGVLGMCGEAGECADLLKKHRHQKHEFDREKMLEEAGDVLWYIAELACGLNATLEEVAQRNIDKLKERYPQGFDPQRSIHRPEYEAANQEGRNGSTPVHLFDMRNKTV